MKVEVKYEVLVNRIETFGTRFIRVWAKVYEDNRLIYMGEGESFRSPKDAAQSVLRRANIAHRAKCLILRHLGGVDVEIPQIKEDDNGLC